MKDSCKRMTAGQFIKKHGDLSTVFNMIVSDYYGNDIQALEANIKNKEKGGDRVIIFDKMLECIESVNPTFKKMPKAQQDPIRREYSRLMWERRRKLVNDWKSKESYVEPPVNNDFSGLEELLVENTDQDQVTSIINAAKQNDAKKVVIEGDRVEVHF
tara:strand:+ start:2368 stop:2841 length:474 start_codon:yes stop_codon:yes gene_type:complete